MELLELGSIAIIIYLLYRGYKRKKDGSHNSDSALVQEWHHLAPASQRFDSRGLDSGYVYFVQESGNYRIKIGKAKDPEQRIQNDFGTIMPYDFNLVHLIKSENYHKTENLFHHHFSDKRFKGEWFDLTEQDIRWLQKEKYTRIIEDSIKGY